jgi:hypothetical protein
MYFSHQSLSEKRKEKNQERKEKKWKVHPSTKFSLTLLCSKLTTVDAQCDPEKKTECALNSLTKNVQNNGRSFKSWVFFGAHWTFNSSTKGLRHKYLSRATSHFIHTSICVFYNISLFSLAVSLYHWLFKSTNSALPAVKRNIFTC